MRAERTSNTSTHERRRDLMTRLSTLSTKEIVELCDLAADGCYKCNAEVRPIVEMHQEDATAPRTARLTWEYQMQIDGEKFQVCEACARRHQDRTAAINQAEVDYSLEREEAEIVEADDPRFAIQAGEANDRGWKGWMLLRAKDDMVIDMKRLYETTVAIGFLEDRDVARKVMGMLQRFEEDRDPVDPEDEVDL